MFGYFVITPPSLLLCLLALCPSVTDALRLFILLESRSLWCRSSWCTIGSFVKSTLLCFLFGDILPIPAAPLLSLLSLASFRFLAFLAAILSCFCIASSSSGVNRILEYEFLADALLRVICNRRDIDAISLVMIFLVNDWSV